MADWHKQETLSKLKKVYSTLAQTTNRAIADNGPIETWEITQGEGSIARSMDFANLYLIPYLNIMKNCKNKITNECNFEYKINGETVTVPNFATRFFLADGSQIAVYPENDTMNGQKYSRIYVDINGKKGPNKNGRDVFFFIYFMKYVDKPEMDGKFTGLYPYWDRERLRSSCISGITGNKITSCAALIMHDGWQISDDYPW